MNLPLVSVLMPVRNEGLYIERSLHAVTAQDYPSEKMEIIVSDGMSNDGTREIVLNYQRQHPNIRLIDNPGQIVAKGLNVVLPQAKGEIIVRVDGHCEIAPDYVRHSVELLQKGEAEIVGGPIETVGETPMAQAIAFAMSSFFGVGGSAFRTVKNEKKYVDTVAFFACRKEILEKAGPFDEELVRNQDDEYNYRLRKLGHRILLDPSIRSRYYSRASLKSLWKQYFQYGFWKVRVMQKHPNQMQWRQFVPPLFVLSLIFSILLGFPGLFAVYLTANLIASLMTSRGQWKSLSILLIIYPILHLSYGLGFLMGLLRFFNRWRIS